MTAAELITELQKVPPETPVKLFVEAGSYAARIDFDLSLWPEAFGEPACLVLKEMS